MRRGGRLRPYFHQQRSRSPTNDGARTLGSQWKFEKYWEALKVM
jgi:hypothetical protein